MLSFQQLSLSLSNKIILKHLEGQIKKGQFWVIVGPNGSGKSSLLRCLSGWYHPTTGQVELNQRILHSYSAKEKASWISFLPQRSHLSESIPIVDLIAAARYRFQESLKVRREKALYYLKHYQSAHLQSRDWSTLSGGEAQRIALTCMRAQEAQIWLLDEPANHLDPAVQREVYHYLFQQWQHGTTLCVVTHTLNLVLSAFPPSQYKHVHVLGLEAGEVAFRCKLSDPSLNEHMSQLYQLPVNRVHVFDRDHLLFGHPTQMINQTDDQSI